MKIFPLSRTASEPGDSHTFTGTVRVNRLASDQSGVPVHVYRVEFESGARTNWHSHSGPQWLFVIEGRVRVQKLGESPQEVVAGDAVMIQPDEKHWHGAAPGFRGVHIAVNVNAVTTWLEPVSNEDYESPKPEFRSA